MPILGPLDDGEIWELVRAARWRRELARTAILREDEPGDSLVFLARGEAKVIKRGRLLNILRAGECFGEMAFVHEGELPRQATVEAVSDVVLAEFQPNEFAKVSAKCQARFMIALVRTMAERLMLANAHLTQAH
jgi:CRP-like cAMP-binding protein